MPAFLRPAIRPALRPAHPGRRSVVRPAVAALTGLLLVGGLAACGPGSSAAASATSAGGGAASVGGTGPSAPASPSTLGATTSTVAATATSATTSAASAGAAGREVRTAGDLVALVKRAASREKSARITFDTTAAGRTVRAAGQVRWGAAGPAMTMTMDLPGAGSTQVVVLDDTLFLKLPPGQSPVAGKPWLKISAAGSDPLSRQLAPLLARLRQAGDPTANLDVLAGAGPITGRARETVGGTAATRYTFAIDVAKGAATATGTTKEALDKLVAIGVKDFRYMLWVDDAGRPVRFVVSEVVRDVAATVTGTYSHWGEPVTITAPPASQTASAADVPSGP